MWTCVFNRIVIIYIKMYFSKSDMQENSFNMALLMIRHLRKVVPRPGVLPAIIFNAFTYSVTFVGLSWAFWAHLAIIMALKGPEMSKQGTVGKRKHVTIMIPLNREVIMRFESGKNWITVMASSIVGLSTVLWCIEMGRSMTIIYGISWKCKGPFQ